MGFLNPVYLAALAALAIPLLIHILSRRRVPVIRFSSLRFLQPSDRRSMKRVNLRRLLLLAMRMLGVALIVLAFARPTMTGRLATLFPGEGVRTACILLDRSYSMGSEQEAGSLFDEARSRVLEILDGFALEDEVMVVLFDSSQELLYSGRMDGPLLREIVAETAPSWGTTDIAGALRAGIEMLGRARGGVRELYIVSDFQRSALGIHASAPVRETGEGERGTDSIDGARLLVFLVQIEIESEANASIERVGVPRTALHRGELAKVELMMKSSGHDAPERFPLELYIDGQLVIEKEIVIESGGYATETFSLSTEKGGWIFGEALKSPDRLRADDRRYFALHVGERVRVLLIADKDSFYLEQAIEPEGADGDIEMTTRSYGGITSADLDRADVVVLGSGGEPSGRDIELLERFVEGGGRLVLFMVPELVTAAERLSSYPLSIDFHDFEEGFLTISEPGAGSRLLGPFGVEDIDAMMRLRFRTAAVVAGVPAGRELLLFSGGSPFIWEESRGEGSCVFIAADPRPGSGDLVLSPYFLPLVQQAVLEAGYRAGSEEGIIVGEPIPLPGTTHGELIVGLPRAGSGGSPVTALVPSAGAEERPEEDLGVPRAEIPGFVILAADGDTLDVLAANVAGGAESDLTPATESEVADSLGIEHWAAVDGGEPVESAVRHAREGREITFGLIIAAALMLLAESVLSQSRFEGKNDVG